METFSADKVATAQQSETPLEVIQKDHVFRFMVNIIDKGKQPEN